MKEKNDISFEIIDKKDIHTETNKIIIELSIQEAKNKNNNKNYDYINGNINNENDDKEKMKLIIKKNQFERIQKLILIRGKII